MKASNRFALAGLLLLAGAANAQSGAISFAPLSARLCEPECRTPSGGFDEKLCIARSDWIVEGVVVYVQALRTSPSEVTIEGMIVKRLYDLKGHHMPGDELVYIGSDRCGAPIRRDWETTNERVRIYGRRAGAADRGVHIEPLGPSDEARAALERDAEPYLLSR